MGIIRDSFVMFKNWSEAIECLPAKYQLECYKAVTKYGLTGEIPEGLSPVVKAMIMSFSVGMENSIAKYKASVENGKLGGRPPKNPEKPSETEQEKEAQNMTLKNLEKPNKTQTNLEKPSQNLNVNVNDNDNVNLLVNKKLINKEARACKSHSDAERESVLKNFNLDGIVTPNWLNTINEIADVMLDVLDSATNEPIKFKRRTYSKEDLIKKFNDITNEHFYSICEQVHFNTEIRDKNFYILGCLLYEN